MRRPYPIPHSPVIVNETYPQPSGDPFGSNAELNRRIDCRDKPGSDECGWRWRRTSDRDKECHVSAAIPPLSGGKLTDASKRVRWSMAFRWLAVLLFVSGLGQHAKADSWDDLKLDMSPVELLAATDRHGARIFTDGSEGAFRIIILGVDIFEQDAILYVFFEDARARMMHLSFYERVHASEPYLTMEACRQVSLSIFDALRTRAELSVLTPTIEPELQGYGTTYTWRSDDAYAKVEFGAPRRDECGWIFASLFDGSEAELDAFHKRLDPKQ